MRRSAALATERRPDLRDAFASDVREGLLAVPKRLAPRWFYDALGSSLFEAICRLPWYRITRAEADLLARHGRAIAGRAGAPGHVIELGSGSGEKLALLLEGFAAHGRAPAVHLVDVSRRALELSERALERFAPIQVRLLEATYLEGLRQAVRADAKGRRIVLFLGSNLGNFDPPDAAAFLRDLATMLAPGDQLLLGLDLVKPAASLLLAYDDPLGVTAAFNKNLLQRLNAELGAAVRLDSFRHEARWNGPARRIEMHLVSCERQTIDVPGARIRATFEAGESIWTESSHKYDEDEIAGFGGVAGFTRADAWKDDDAGFALTLFERARDARRPPEAG
jgi:L-histidine Nalpha-methyltransferase